MEKLPNGLIVGHAYSVTDVKAVEFLVGEKPRKIPLIRVRNPWGDAAEWKGAWSDKYSLFLIFLDRFFFIK